MGLQNHVSDRGYQFFLTGLNYLTHRLAPGMSFYGYLDDALPLYKVGLPDEFFLFLSNSLNLR